MLRALRLRGKCLTPLPLAIDSKPHHREPITREPNRHPRGARVLRSLSSSTAAAPYTGGLHRTISDASGGYGERRSRETVVS